jgi:DHA1 family tetracycline resistance protein-like MFS transporter
LGGLLSEWGNRMPFVAAAILSLLNFLYGLFILPESLKTENRRTFDIKRANPFGSFLQIKKKKEIRILLIVLFFVFVSAQVMPSVWPFYTKYLFHWSDLEIGYSLTFVGIMIAVVKGGLVNFANLKFGSHRTVYIGLLLYMTGLFLFSFSSQSWMLYTVAFIYCLGGIAPPSLQGIISARVNDNEQGELQGVITSLLSLANIVSPLIMTHLFYFFCKETTGMYFPGAPFALAAMIIFIGLLLCFKELKKKNSYIYE